MKEKYRLGIVLGIGIGLGATLATVYGAAGGALGFVAGMPLSFLVLGVIDKELWE